MYKLSDRCARLTNNPNSTDLRKAIIDALRQHPEGLTLRDIAEIVGRHRHTITKYVYELIGAQVIYQRDVGAAKLCYLKENYNGPEKGKGVKIFSNMSKGQVQLMALFMLLLLVPATVIVAQNVTNSSSGLEGMATAMDIELNETLDDVLNETILDENVSGDIPEGEANHQVPGNTTEEETSEEETAPQEPDNVTEENITEPGLNITQPSVNVTINVTINETQENATTNITQPEENVTMPEENVTIVNETNVTYPEENITIPGPLEPELFVNITSPDNITRGESARLEAVIENTGGEAEDVILEWILPDFFVVVAGSEREEVGTLAANSSFASEITVSSTINVSLGINEIKVRVSYE